MAGQMRLGRAFGIAVAVHWSVLVIALLFVWSLAKASLPALSPGQSPLAYWTTATATTVLLFGSLLAHELAHAVVARREGVGVEQMTLWLFGGVTTLRGEPESPGAAFRIAAAGPVTSLVLGGVFVGTGYASRLLNAPQLAVAAAMWLGATNVILAAFNLVPGAPLDGGRVLRAYLWRRRGDLAHATVTAARAGQAVGLALAAVGLGELLAGDAGNGLWLAFIGCFLVTAATQERNNALLRRRLTDVRVAEVMTPDPETAPGSLPCREVPRQSPLGP